MTTQEVRHRIEDLLWLTAAWVFLAYTITASDDPGFDTFATLVLIGVSIGMGAQLAWLAGWWSRGR